MQASLEKTGEQPMELQEFDRRLKELLRSKRKEDVLKAFLTGDEDSEVAKKLQLEPNTVTRHIAEISKHFELRQQARERCRPELVELFYKNKREWVSQTVLTRYGIKPEPKSRCEAPEYPGGFLPLGSPFYVTPVVRQEKVLQTCVNKIEQRGALLRIKSPHETGKTSLLERILRFAEEKRSYRVARFNLRDIDATRFNGLNSLLQMFCREVSEQLGLDADLENQWDHKTDPIPAAKGFFHRWILGKIDAPIVVGLEDIDRLFQYPSVYDFFTLLRSWNDEARRSLLWEKFRCVVTYSTDVYIKLDINNSPFNVGTPVTLPPLTAEQIQDLARKAYGFSVLNEVAVRHLMYVVSGHPYLIQLALYHHATDAVPLEQLLASASMPHGIYRGHLQSIWQQVQPENQHLRDEIVDALKKVISEGAAWLTDEVGYKLQGLGILQPEGIGGDRYKFSCALYRQYFERRLELKR